MSKTVVMKFGGTSVGSPERIAEVARRVVGVRRENGDRVVVVVSAMSGETNRLVELAHSIGGAHAIGTREYDQLLTSGEQASCALTAMALEREGQSSRSLVAPQVGIRTHDVDGKAQIGQIDTTVLENLLQQDIVPVVAGFQGVNHTGDYTTLGRGGSDTTAVAVAAALNADRCVILTDVDGVYTANPSICRGARLLPELSYEEMLELASSGAKVLQTRSVHLARKFRVPIEVCSSFNQNPGSVITQEYEGMEDNVVSGVTCLGDQARITLRQLPDRPGIVAEVFECIHGAGMVVDMIVQSQGEAGSAQMTFTLPVDESERAYDSLVGELSARMPDVSVEIDKNIAKLSVVGEGMRAHSGIAAKMFGILGREGINIEMVSTSEIKVSVAIDQKYSELAVRALHEAFVEEAEKA